MDVASVKQVLLIEDEKAISFIYKRQLDLAGFLTDTYDNGTEGLAAIKKKRYDIALLDIMLPDINGLQILKEIKKDPTTKDILCVMLTNLGQESIIKEGFSLGAEGFLIKASYTPDEVVKELQTLLAQHEQNLAKASVDTATSPLLPPIQSEPEETK
jgi:DNA-binding response OmpR family regulator